ncbi:hypothetical protein UY3_14409 [Chelonia mydas]|uniref:Uncharacterized protein n=1 Tax=Chelonia mydas TaxID=8469 RepID=M7AZD4_CHEMY|nr:hypothetical protein UY3_14409 [Chelonia mydas]
MKVKELRQAYQKAKEASSRSGSEPHTCHFNDQLHGILGGDPTTTPPLSMDTCKEGVSCNMEEDFLDEEEEEEEEENAQQQAVNPFSLAARTFSSPWSQYLPKARSLTLKAEKAPLVQPIAAPTGHGMLLQANGGCGRTASTSLGSCRFLQPPLAWSGEPQPVGATSG